MFAKKGALNVVAGFSPRRRPCEIVETRAKAGDYILVTPFEDFVVQVAAYL